MDFFHLLKWAHLIGASVLLGTGAGIAFFMLMAHRTKDAAFIAKTASGVVIADMLFTATAVVFQPVTGVLLARNAGWDFTEGWIILSIILFAITGLCWLPVVWIQIQLRDIAQKCAQTNSPLSKKYNGLFVIWTGLGIPAFVSVLLIFWLMTAKPSISLF